MKNAEHEKHPIWSSNVEWEEDHAWEPEEYEASKGQKGKDKSPSLKGSLRERARRDQSPRRLHGLCHCPTATLFSNVSALRKIALYGHDAKNVKQHFALHFENTAQSGEGLLVG